MDVKGSLMSSVNEVLDKMAFMFFEEMELEEESELSSFITQVNISGVITGTLNIMVADETAREIARNLIGIRDDDDLFQETLGDALVEFTNLIAGRTMTILKPTERFNMEIPALVDHPAAPEEGQTVLDIRGTLDDEPFRIRLQYRETAG